MRVKVGTGGGDEKGGRDNNNKTKQKTHQRVALLASETASGIYRREESITRLVGEARSCSPRVTVCVCPP